MTDTIRRVEMSNEELDLFFEVLLQINSSIELLNESLLSEEVEDNESEIEEVDPEDTELFQLKEIKKKQNLQMNSYQN